MAPNEQVSVSMDFESAIDKINEAVTLEVPQDATLFDLGQFLGMPSTPTTPVVE